VDVDNTPPSPLRIPVTALLAVTAPPLALGAWILLSGGKRRLYWRALWVRAGAISFAIGALPLLILSLLVAVRLWPDPNPNPIGLGLFFVAAAILACILLLIGILLVAFGPDEA
jgi:hypothetical protein